MDRDGLKKQIELNELWLTDRRQEEEENRSATTVPVSCVLLSEIKVLHSKSFSNGI